MRQLGCIRARHYREELEVKHHDEREEGYLYLTTFHQRAVELLPGFLCVGAGLKRHEAEALWSERRCSVREPKPGKLLARFKQQ